MSATRRHWLRHPKTQQERRISQGKNDSLVRAKRRARRLPTNYDDIQPCVQKSWKTRRDRQWRSDKDGYAWRRYEFPRRGWPYLKLVKITNTLERLGCYYERIGMGIIWFGPDVT